MEKQKQFASNWAPVGGIIGLLAVTLGLALFVRSRNESKAEIAAPVPIPAIAGAASTPASSAIATPQVPSKTAARKTTRQRPAIVTYSDPTYGVSFRYPRKYALKHGANGTVWPGLSPEEMNFVEPGGVNVATVVLPQGTYPETDFQSAFFAVSVNQSLTEAECAEFAFPSHLTRDEVVPAKLKIGGMDLLEVEQIDGEPANQADAKYYHGFQNGACYEFALGLGTMSGDTEDTITPVDRSQVFERLEKILASVKIKAESAPEVVAGTSVTPVK